MLGALRHEWSPAAMIVSFKLETDIQILLQKVRDGAGFPPQSAVLCCSGGALPACQSAESLHTLSRTARQAYGAIEAYGVHLVVANELHSRKDHVWLVAQRVRRVGQAVKVHSALATDKHQQHGCLSGAIGPTHVRVNTLHLVASARCAYCLLSRLCPLPSPSGPQDGAQVVQQIERPADIAEIETLLVSEVVAAHKQHMQQQQQPEQQQQAR